MGSKSSCTSIACCQKADSTASFVGDDDFVSAGLARQVGVQIPSGADAEIHHAAQSQDIADGAASAFGLGDDFIVRHCARYRIALWVRYDTIVGDSAARIDMCRGGI